MSTGWTCETVCVSAWAGQVLDQARGLTALLPQITSMSQSPWEDWLLVGLASGLHWLQPTLKGQAHLAGHKNGAILDLKFSPYGKRPPRSCLPRGTRHCPGSQRVARDGTGPLVGCPAVPILCDVVLSVSSRPVVGQCGHGQDDHHSQHAQRDHGVAGVPGWRRMLGTLQCPPDGPQGGGAA